MHSKKSEGAGRLAIRDKSSGLQKALVYGGSAGLIATLFILADGYEGLSLSFGDLETLRVFMLSSASAALGACVVLVLYSALAGREWSRLFSAGCALAFLGMAGASLLPIVQAPLIGYVLIGLMFGSGLCLLCGRWLLALTAYSGKDLLDILSISLIIAGSYKAATLSLGWWFGITPFLVLAVGAASVIVFVRKEAGKPAEREPYESFAPQLKSLVEQGWVLMVALLLCVYVIGAAWSAAFEGGLIASSPRVEGLWGSVLGSLIGGAVLLLVSRRGKGLTGAAMSQVIPLACIVSLLIAWFLGSWDSDIGRFISNIPIGFSVPVLGVLLCAQMREDQTESLPTLLVFGLNALVVIAFLIIVMLIWPFLGDGLAQSIHLTLMVVYLFAVAVLALVRGGGRQGRSQASRNEMADAVTAIKEGYGLSAREMEILEFLIQGRSAPYIAKELYVSVNTVKTHMKRIYQKLDVHSREELLDLYLKTVDEMPAENAG